MLKKIALVTGASRGIGRACALSLSRSGIYVIGTSTNSFGVAKINKYFKNAGIEGCGKILNLNDHASITNLFKEIKREHDCLHNILVNNAGITNDSIILNMNSSQWKNVIEINLNAVFYITKLSLYGMLKRKWGRIVNISSICGITGNAGQANYAAAKSGMIGFTKSLALEIGRFGITANTVAPGFVDTDMIKNIDKRINLGIIKEIPLRRIGTVKDVANAVQFLVSEDSSYITGQTINVNGGVLMN